MAQKWWFLYVKFLFSSPENAHSCAEPRHLTCFAWKSVQGPCSLLTGLLKNCSSILYSFVEWLGEGHLKSNWLTLGDRDSRPTSTVVQMSKFFLPAQRILKRGIWYGNVACWVSVTHPYCIKTAKAVLKLF